MNFSGGSASHCGMDGISHFSANEIGTYGGFVASGAQRSLALLNAIEQTVFAVSTICSEMRGFRTVIDQINRSFPSISGKIEESLLMADLGKTQESLASLHTGLNRGHNSARRDPALTEQDGVESTFAEAIAHVDGLHEDIETLRWNIMQHNASLDTSDAGHALTNDQDIDAFFSRL